MCWSLGRERLSRPAGDALIGNKCQEIGGGTPWVAVLDTGRGHHSLTLQAPQARNKDKVSHKHCQVLARTARNQWQRKNHLKDTRKSSVAERALHSIAHSHGANIFGCKFLRPHKMYRFVCTVSEPLCFCAKQPYTPPVSDCYF